MHECQVCQESFSSRNQLFAHLRSQHQSSSASAGRETVCFDLSQHAEVSIAHEDDWARVVVKPQGLATMGSEDSALFQHSILLMPERFAHGVSYRKAIPCHRLDRATGGLVVCSKSRESETMLRLCFRHKLIQKRYCAIVAGRTDEDDGEIRSPVGGKDSLTRYRVLARTPSAQYGEVTTLSLWPVTGRRHQLRKHLQSVKHSIIGDRRYSHAASWPSGIDRLFLWAVEVSLPHPSAVAAAVKSLNVELEELAKDLQNYNSDDDDDDDNNEPANKSNTNDDQALASSEQKEKRQKVSDDNIVKERSVSVLNNDSASFAAKLALLLKDSERLVVTIDEPKYYEQFRQREAKSIVKENS